MGGMKVDISGFEEMRKQWEEMQVGFEAFLRSFLLKEALRVLAKTKKLTPHISGYLRNSWFIGDAKNIVSYRQGIKRTKIKRHKPGERKNQKYRQKPQLRFSSITLQGATVNSVKRNGDSLTVEIINPAEYASYVEYGHVTRSRKGKDGKGSARSGWVQGQFMCTISIKEVESRMPAHFNAEFKKWVKSMGVGK